MMGTIAGPSSGSRLRKVRQQRRRIGREACRERPFLEERPPARLVRSSQASDDRGLLAGNTIIDIGKPLPFRHLLGQVLVEMRADAFQEGESDLVVLALAAIGAAL